MSYHDEIQYMTWKQYFPTNMESPHSESCWSYRMLNRFKQIRPTELHQRESIWRHYITVSCTKKAQEGIQQEGSPSRVQRRGLSVEKDTTHPQGSRRKWTSNCEKSYAVKNVFSDTAIEHHYNERRGASALSKLWRCQLILCLKKKRGSLSRKPKRVA
jgi:hypothetical protein